MKVQFHTSKGIVEIDTEKVSDSQLSKLGVKREDLPTPIRDLAAEIDNLKIRLGKLEP